MAALKIPNKYMRGQGIVYVCTATVKASQRFIVEGDRQTVTVKVSRKPRGVLRKRDVQFKNLSPLWDP
jgi:hypothetical protein